MILALIITFNVTCITHDPDDFDRLSDSVAQALESERSETSAALVGRTPHE